MLKKIFLPNKLSIIIAVIIFLVLIIAPVVGPYPIQCITAPCNPLYNSFALYLNGIVGWPSSLIICIILSYTIASFIAFVLKNKK